MWAWLPDELLQRIAHQLIAGNSARQLRVVAVLDRRSHVIAQVHLEDMKALTRPPFSLSGHDILGGMTLLDLSRRDIQAQHVQLLGAGLASGALASLKELYLFNNQIGDIGLSALAEAVSKGALPALKLLHLQYNQISDTGISSFADAVSKGALPNLKEIYLFQDAPALEAACKARGIGFQ